MFYLFMGFFAVWILVTLYLVYVGWRQRQLEEELRAMREQVESSRRK